MPKVWRHFYPQHSKKKKKKGICGIEPAELVWHVGTSAVCENLKQRHVLTERGPFGKKASLLDGAANAKATELLSR